MKVEKIIKKFDKDRSRLMDILIEVQQEEGCISEKAVNTIADKLKISAVDVEQTASFYHFFTKESAGKYTVYLNNSAVANMMGRAEVAKAFEEAAGTNFGSVTSDGKIGLFDTACIGMNDQEPAAIIGNQVFTNLTPDKARSLVKDMQAGKKIKEMVGKKGDGKNADELINSMVCNNVQQTGKVVLADDYEPGKAIEKAISMKSEDIISEVKKSNMRGRGGAGFPTGLKWDFCSKAKDKTKYVLCNADEGEPGTFKDRVLLTERPELLFEGMVIAGYAIDAKEGILYLRSEYTYLKKYLEDVLEKMRGQKRLGKKIAGSSFNYDIRIQMGAGAYVCGEESALIESAEGKRGEPRNRPPFPVECGYMDKPTVVNNVETLCTVAKIIVKGAEWFRGIGTENSSGTKVLSVSGDCAKPGVYEVDWGISIQELIDLVGADNPKAVQVAGPSGSCIGPKNYGRKLAFEDLATGGSMIMIGQNRDLLEVVKNFTEFFVDESCGSCVPCRNMTEVLNKKLAKIMAGNGITQDLEDMEKWAGIMKSANRCGLGQTAANPIITTIQNFREVYEAKLLKDKDFATDFNLEAAVKESCAAAGRTPNL